MLILAERQGSMPVVAYVSCFMSSFHCVENAMMTENFGGMTVIPSTCQECSPLG